MASFMFPGLLADWTGGMQGFDPTKAPTGLLSPDLMGGASAGGFAPFAAPAPSPAPAPAPFDDPFRGEPGFNAQPAPVNGRPMPAIPGPDNPVPAFTPVPSEFSFATGPLEGSPEAGQMRERMANAPAQGASPAGGAPQEQPGFLDRLSTVLGGVYGQGGPGDGLINLGLALMSPGNKAENVMRAGQMAQANEYRKSQLLAQQQKQQREALALKGNAELVMKAFPGMSAEQALAAAQQPALVQEAVKRINPNETVRTVTSPEERRRLGIPDSYTGPVQMDQAGKLLMPGRPTTEVNVNNGGNDKFNDSIATQQAQTFIEMSKEAVNAKADISRIGQLRAQIEKLPGGFLGGAQALAGQYGIKLGPNADALEAAGAIINQLVPAQRPAGSGTMSDRDVDMFKQALPRLSNTPAGNKIILDTMEAMARYKQTQGDIATQVITGQIDRAEGMRRLQALPDPLAGFKNASGDGQPDADGWTTVNGYRVRKVN